MQTPAPAATAAPSASRTRALAPVVAPAALGLALLAGVAGDILLDQGLGVGFPLWIGVIAAAIVALAWRAELAIPREGAAWLAVALVASLGVAWRESEMLQFFDVCAAIGALVMAAATINHAGSVLFAPRLRDTVRTCVLVCRDIALGILPLVFREAPTATQGTNTRRGLVRAARVALIALPLLIVFGALLRSADPIFASLVTLPGFDADTVGRHLFVIAVFTAIVGGLVRAALLEKTNAPSASPDFIRIDALEVTAALGTLNLLFTAYVLTQLGWFFGGERFLQERTGLTAAEYARGGFFQMVWVVMLVVPLLVATRAFLTPGKALARRHTLLAMPTVGLLGAMIISAALRMRLYVHYYGLSIDRFYPLVFMGWLAVVLCWLAVTVLRGWGRPFVAGAAISAFATLVGLNLSAPDRIVARVNLARVASDTTPLDVRYLSQLSGEAAELAVQATLAAPKLPAGVQVGARADTARCEAARTLLRRWGPTSSARIEREQLAAWRGWNAGEASALRAVGAESGRLRAIMHAECARPAAPTTQR